MPPTKQRWHPLMRWMDKIENHLLALANEQGVQSFATEHGTAYKHTATYRKVEDWGAFQTSLVKQMTIAIDAAMPCDDEDKASCHVRLKVSKKRKALGRGLDALLSAERPRTSY